jgi:Flp pilus assembly protein TadD
VCLELGKTDEAQQLLERSRDGFKKLAPDHSWNLIVKRNLALVYGKQHRLSEAETLLKK